MPAWAPERGSRTPTLSGPPCARAKSPAAVASNPAAPAPTAKPRRVRPEELGVVGIILSSQGGSRLACPVFSYSSLPDAMGHDSAPDAIPHSVIARWQEPRRPGAISPSMRASIAIGIAGGGAHGRRTCPYRAAGG